MKADPFEFDNSEPTILKRSSLEDVIKQYGGRKKKAEKAEENEKK
jgi:hypothetical protein